MGFNEDFETDVSKTEGRTIKKLRVVKIIGLIIVLLIVLIQVFRIIYFDLTAVPIVKI